MTAKLQASNLNKVYEIGRETVYAVNDVALEVQPGELVAILDKPGSGKSTLLHILGCLQRPDSGRVWIENLDTTRLDVEELARVRTHKVGFVFQAFNLLPNETAIANVELPLRNQRVDAWNSRQRAEEALQVVGLGNRLEHRPGQLSARQRQSVAIARALVNDPAVLFADEPTRALDSTSREEVMGLFQKLNDEGRTTVIATADSGVANYCHRMVRIAEGRTVDEGPVSSRRVIPSSRIPGPPSRSYAREVTVCPRCAYGNFADEILCGRCEFPRHLTDEEEQSIQGRLIGAESRLLGVESASDEGKFHGQGLPDELKEVPFFAGLGSKSLAKLMSGLEQRRFPEGSTIVKQGDAGDAFYVVRSGTVRVVLERGGMPGIQIATLGPKDGFGEMALLTDQPRSASVLALTDVETWRLSKVAFEGLLEESLSLAVYFNRILSRRLSAVQKKIVP